MSDEMKVAAGRAALDFVEPGMKLGIGTGSTAEAFIRLLAERVNEGLDVVGVPTSERTAKLCNELGIALSTLDEMPSLDLTVDGADEVDPSFNLIKGAGGALLREKIVASASDSMTVIVDESKVVNVLGAFDLPIEVNIFGLEATKLKILAVAAQLELAGDLTLRCNADGTTFTTDGGHAILDASFGHIPKPEALDRALKTIPGVVENGLFTGLASRVIVAGETGIRILQA